MSDPEDTSTWEGNERGPVALAPTYGRFVVTGSLGSGGMGVVLAAHDPELDRRVALKLLRPDRSEGGERARARLLREAQAMAKLAHPHVVTVYEVGQAGDQLFIAMELIEGQTLRRWLASAPRSAGEILRVLVGAGRGLEAAHRAALVHRDFKPENVLIGTDERPRVADFGLVATGVRVASGEHPGAARAAAGAVVGTPAYMSPEQLAGGEVDARSDQFAFAATAWEALSGRRAFVADEIGALRAAIERGGPAPMPRERRVPANIERALARSLSADPSARWPSMSALLDELEGHHRRRRRVWGALAGALIVGGAVGAAAVGLGDRCALPSDRVEGVWSAARRGPLEAIVERADPTYGRARLDIAARALDRYLDDWGAMYVAACRATHVDGRQSDALLDLRMRCLDQRLESAVRSVALLERAGDVRAVDGAIAAIVELGTLDGCADAAALERAASPPASPRAREVAREIADERDALEVRRAAGEFAAILRAATALVERAARLEHAPTSAVALELLARTQVDAEYHAAAVATLERLATVAATAGLDGLVAYAWTETARLKAWELAKPDEGAALLPAARAAAARAGRPFDAELRLVIAESVVLGATGHVDQEAERLRAAEKMLRDRGAEAAGAPLLAPLARVVMLRGVAVMRSDPDASVAALSEALTLFERAYGPDHPALCTALINLAEAERRAGRYERAREASQRGVDIARARLGASPLLMRVAMQLGTIERELHHYDRALTLLTEGVELARRLLRADDVKLLWALLGLGSQYEDMEQFDAATSIYDEVIASARAQGLRHPNVAIALFNRGEIRARRGQCADAVDDFRRGSEILDAESTTQLYLLRARGACLVQLGQRDEARAVLERVVAWPKAGRAVSQQVLAEYWLGRLAMTTPASARAGRQRAAAAVARLRDLPDVMPVDVRALEAALR